jgi:uncharacterized protein YndB with AHSA1/START domain
MKLATILLGALVFTLAGLTAPRAEDAAPLAHEVVVEAPLETVWDLYTTKAGIEAWMVAKTEIDLRLDGVWRTHYSKDGVLGDAGTIEHRILALDPKRMLAIRTLKCPEKFPFKTAISKMWTVLYFEPVDATHTKVICRSLGFDASEESQKMRAFFSQGNAYELDQLKKHIARRSGAR